MTRRLALLASLAVSILASSAHAQIALYEGRLPDGYAYVRFANTTSAPIALISAFAAPLQLGTADAARISPYHVIEKVAGKTLSVSSAAGDVRFTLEPGRFHTILLDQVGPKLVGKVLTDVTEYNRQRAKLSLYNAKPDCPSASLVLEPAGQVVFSEVPFGEMRTRGVMPVEEAMVHATCGAVSTKSLDLEELHEGALYSVWLMAQAGGATLFVAQDFIAPYQK